jgi:TRAP-type C4-dicarboxylate transport system substrate-binding protein
MGKAVQLVGPLDQSVALGRTARRRAWSHHPEEDSMRHLKRIVLHCLAVAVLAVPAAVPAQQPITLHGAVQFNDGHAFNRSLEKFQELTAKYYGKPINFVLHKNSELGLEKDYFAFMNQGISVDYGIVSPAHMSTFSKAAPFIDAPFLFRDIDHWNKVLDADTLKPIADEVSAKGDVMLIGFAGGGTRNIFANKAVRNLQEMKGLKVRVQGAPIWSKTFAAVGMSPTVIAYDEIYNAIQNGVINAGENEAAGVEAMKFYEVGPNLNMTQHAITIRPICFSGKTFKKLPPDLQAAIIRAGKEAGIYGRQIESGEDQKKLEALQAAGKLKMIPFADRAQMKKLADPVMAEYAKDIGASDIYNKINSM